MEPQVRLADDGARLADDVSTLNGSEVLAVCEDDLNSVGRRQEPQLNRDRCTGTGWL